MADDQFDDFFRRMMKKFFKDFEDIEKQFGQPKDLARGPRGWVIKAPDGQVGGGFSISIKSDGKEPPRIDVKRFGPSGKWEKMPLGRGEPVPVGTGAEKKPMRVRMPAQEEAVPSLGERAIPEYKVSIGADEVTITMNAEGVESPKDVKLMFYPESVEVYASARKLDRQYFCTVALPSAIGRQGQKVKVEKGKVIISISRKMQTT